MKSLIVVFLIVFDFFSAVASDFPPNVEANEKTIQALIEVGANQKKPHLLEHHFYGLDLKSLNALISKGQSMGYRSQKVEKSEYKDKYYWSGSLLKETILDLSLINKENSIMLALAEQFQVSYDGWGTQVVE